MNQPIALSLRSPTGIMTLLTALVLGASLSGCLKTRAQLKDDNDDAAASKPVPAQVNDVQPQGQYVIDEIKGEMTRMDGRIEDLERAQKQNAGAGTSKEDSKKLEERVTELEAAQAQMIEQLKKLQDSVPSSEGPEALEKAKAKFDSGDFDGAIQSLDAYLKNPKAKKTEEATWLRAESYYSAKEYKKAIIDYSKFPEKFTKSKLLPQALYKIGLSFDALGMHDDAKGFYQDLADKFPKAPEAKKARAKLK